MVTRPATIQVIVGMLFAAWLSACSGETSTPLAATLNPQQSKGQSLFIKNCAACHAIAPDVVLVGPSLSGIAERAAGREDGLEARQYLELSILNPEAFTVEGFESLMPTDLGKKLTTEELNALVEYLMTL
ncbi:MAG: c-type cytochrome [Anaerolineae bacterium]|nr:c-type cytochrome [Anaerolineae bacterium]